MGGGRERERETAILILWQKRMQTLEIDANIGMGKLNIENNVGRIFNDVLVNMRLIRMHNRILVRYFLVSLDFYFVIDF